MNKADVKKLFVEPTSVCNARCLTCSATKNRQSIKTESIDLSAYEGMLDGLKLDRVLMSGKSGEPTLAPGFLDMVSVTQDKADRIKIASNGSTNDEEWWAELGSRLRDADAVTFGIDGLEETHGLNRQGTSFDKITRNAQAFIDAGGTAIWQFITFEQNKHDVEEACDRAVKMGFDAFFTRSSYKYVPGRLNRPRSDEKTQEERSTESSDKVTCSLFDGGEAYVAASGIIYPCPRIAPIPGKPGREAFYNTGIARLADLSFFDCSLAYKGSIENAISSKIFKHLEQNRHTTDPCTRLCRAGKTSTNFVFLHGSDWE